MAGVLYGVAIVGPFARRLDDGNALKVTRLATDGQPNACSFLYGAAWRTARALGFKRLITYTLCSESGSSLRAWQPVCKTKGGSWDRPVPRRTDQHPRGPKMRWQVAQPPARGIPAGCARNGSTRAQPEVGCVALHYRPMCITERTRKSALSARRVRTVSCYGPTEVDPSETGMERTPNARRTWSV